MQIIRNVNAWIKKLDKLPLWIVGIAFLLLLFVPYILLGEGSVFTVHDQLDETLFTYVLTAKHLFTGTEIYPEMMSGMNASGMMPSALLFVMLYKIFPLFPAFVLQYFCVAASAFFGMYFLVRKLTKSNGISFVIAALFCMLPYQPVYGLSIVGLPLLIVCMWQLYEEQYKIVSMLGIVYFSLTTHLVLIGYVALTYLGIAIILLLWKKKGIKKEDRWFYFGVILLTTVYCIVNYDMFLQLIVGTGDFVSHREELVNNTVSINTWKNIVGVFLGGGDHVATCHLYFIIPMAIITLIQGIRYKKLSDHGKWLWKILVIVWISAMITALLYGFFTSELVMTWRNSQSGFFRYFQADRYYWAYPTIWWMAFGVSLGLVWSDFPKLNETIKVLIFILIAVPTVNFVKVSSNLYDNLNGYNHGSEYTGKLTWGEFYMQDVLEKVDEYIGRDKSTYRIASLGRCPAPTLFYGFYTIDGYSNNYSLDYKHEFRTIIEKELEKNGDVQVYFDVWGSRCYLYSAESARNLYMRKDVEFAYQNLELNLEKMKEMGCEYIFSAAEIRNAEEIGLDFEERFDTEESIYEVWLYRII